MAKVARIKEDPKIWQKLHQASAWSEKFDHVFYIADLTAVKRASSKTPLPTKSKYPPQHLAYGASEAAPTATQTVVDMAYAREGELAFGDAGGPWEPVSHATAVSEASAYDDYTGQVVVYKGKKYPLYHALQADPTYEAGGVMEVGGTYSGKGLPAGKYIMMVVPGEGVYPIELSKLTGEGAKTYSLFGVLPKISEAEAASALVGAAGSAVVGAAKYGIQLIGSEYTEAATATMVQMYGIYGIEKSMSETGGDGGCGGDTDPGPWCETRERGPAYTLETADEPASYIGDPRLDVDTYDVEDEILGHVARWGERNGFFKPGTNLLSPRAFTKFNAPEAYNIPDLLTYLKAHAHEHATGILYAGTVVPNDQWPTGFQGGTHELVGYAADGTAMPIISALPGTSPAGGKYVYKYAYAFHVAIPLSSFLQHKHPNCEVPPLGTLGDFQAGAKKAEIKKEIAQEKKEVATTPPLPEPPTPSVKKLTEPPAKPTVPSSTDKAITSGNKLLGTEKHTFVAQLYSIPSYVDVATKVLERIDEKMKTYGIEFPDQPLSLKAQIENLLLFKNNIKSYATKINPTVTDTERIVLEFDNTFKLIKLQLEDGPESGELASHPNVKQLANKMPFASVTANALIFHLPHIYKEFHAQFGAVGWTPTSEHEVRGFLSRYIYPPVIIINSVLGEYVVEKYLLGDVKLLDDKFWKKYKSTPEDIRTRAKINLRKSIAQQYEQIGDALGKNFKTGKFKQIDDFRDFYKQVLAYIDIPALIQLTALCAMKAIGMDEWIDKICRETIENFEKHREAVIEWCENQEAPATRAMAKELKNLLFAVEDAYIKQIGSLVESGTEFLLEKAGLAAKRGSWNDTGSIIRFLSGLKAQVKVRQKELMRASPLDLPATIADQIDNMEAEVAELEEAITRQRQRQTDLGSSLPANEKGLISDFSSQKASVASKLKQLTSSRTSSIEQLQLYWLLLIEIVPRIIALNPYLKTGGKKGDTNLNVIWNWGPYTSTGREYQAKWMGFVDVTGDSGDLKFLYEFVKPPQYGTGGGWTEHASGPDAAKAMAFLNSEVLNTRLTELASQHRSIIKTGGLNFIIPSKYAEWLSTYRTMVHVVGPGQKEQKVLRSKVEDIYDSMIERISLLVQVIAQKEKQRVGEIADLPSQAAKGGKAALLEIFDKDQRKRAILCAAIFAVVPAAFAGLIYLLENRQQLATTLKKDIEKMGKAVDRRLEMMFGTKLPVMDILESLKEMAKQVGLNLLRDLVVNTLQWLIENLKAACKDEEQLDAPYSPFGQIDLSEFITASQTNNNVASGQGALDTAPSYNKLTAQTGIGSAAFRSLLQALSSSFTIREMCSLLDETAPYELYNRAIIVLQSVTQIQGTQFEVYYTTPDGIKIFFNLIAKDIKPEYCILAKQTFDNQKKILLNICVSPSDDVLAAHLANFLDPDQLLAAMANQRQSNLDLAGKVSDLLGQIMEGPIEAKPFCPPRHDSQKLAANYAGGAIFKGIEDAFEVDIGKIKDILSDEAERRRLISALKKSKAQFAFMHRGLTTKSFDGAELLKEIYDSYDPEYVGKPIREGIQASLKGTFVVKYVEPNLFDGSNFWDGVEVKYTKEPSKKELFSKNKVIEVSWPFLETIQIAFSNVFNPKESTNIIGADSSLPLFFVENLVEAMTVPGVSWDGDSGSGFNFGPIAMQEIKNIASTIVDTSEDLSAIALPLLAGMPTINWMATAVPASFDIGKGTEVQFIWAPLPNRYIRFKYKRTTAGQPNTRLNVVDATTGEILVDYATTKDLPLNFYTLYTEGNDLSAELNNLVFWRFAWDSRLYAILLNSILEDMLRYSTESGLFKRKTFNKLHLNIHRPYKYLRNSQILNSEKCFLGFFNKSVLNKQAQSMTDALACFTPNSITKSSDTLAFVKLLVDCFLRVIAVKEAMRTLFAFGTFNLSELLNMAPDGEPSFFQTYFKKEVEKALEKHFISAAEQVQFTTADDGSIIDFGSIQTFQTGIVVKWVLNTMKILYQNDKMTGAEALSIALWEQVAYVQKVLYKGLPLEVLTEQQGGALAAYQIVGTGIEDTSFDFDPVEGGPDALKSAIGKYIKLDSLNNSIKLLTIQNDKLAAYLNPSPKGEFGEGISDALSAYLDFYHRRYDLSEHEGGAHAAIAHHKKSIMKWWNLGPEEGIHATIASAISTAISGIAGYFSDDSGGTVIDDYYLYDLGIWTSLCRYAYGHKPGEVDAWKGGGLIKPIKQERVTLPGGLTKITADGSLSAVLSELGGEDMWPIGFTPPRIRRRPEFSEGFNSANKTLTFLNGVDSGLVNDPYVEIKYNASFYNNLTATQKLTLKAFFQALTYEFDSEEKIVNLKNFLYETKLILFFPQIYPYLETSLGIQFKASVTVFDEIKGKDFRGSLIFWHMFQYNFLGGVPMTDEKQTVTGKIDISYIYRYYGTTGMAFSGKIFLSDWMKITSNFQPPSRAYAAAQQDIINEGVLPDAFASFSPMGKSYYGIIGTPPRPPDPVAKPFDLGLWLSSYVGSDPLVLAMVEAFGGIDFTEATAWAEDSIFDATLLGATLKESLGIYFKEIPNEAYDAGPELVPPEVITQQLVDNFFLRHPQTGLPTWWVKNAIPKDLVDRSSTSSWTNYFIERATDHFHSTTEPHVDTVIDGKTASINIHNAWLNLFREEPYGSGEKGPIFQLSDDENAALATIGWTKNNFFMWLYTKNVKDLYDIHFGYNLNQYTSVADLENPDAFIAAYDSVYGGNIIIDDGISVRAKACDDLVKEKIGRVYIGSNQVSEKDDEFKFDWVPYNVIPIFNVSKGLPDNLTYFDYIYKTTHLMKFNSQYIFTWSGAKPVAVYSTGPGQYATNPATEEPEWAPQPLAVNEDGTLATDPETMQQIAESKEWIGLEACPRGDIVGYVHMYMKMYYNYEWIDEIDFGSSIQVPPAGSMAIGSSSPYAGSYLEVDGLPPTNFMGTWWKIASFGGFAMLIAQDTVDLIFGQQYNTIATTTIRFVCDKPTGGIDDSLGYKESHTKMFFAMMSENKKALFDKIIQSLFLKEQTTIVAIVHRLMSDKHYPEIDGCFDKTTSTILNAMTTAIAVANGDYTYISPATDPSIPFPLNPADIDFGKVTEMILKAMLGGLANTVDPTWKTDWFLPGPFTPIGVAAKLMIGQDWGDKDERDIDREQKTCEDALDEQAKLIDLGPFFNK